MVLVLQPLGGVSSSSVTSAIEYRRNRSRLPSRQHTLSSSSGGMMTISSLLQPSSPRDSGDRDPLPVIPMTSLTMERVIGVGSFGEVQLAWWTRSDPLAELEVAVKANGLACANVSAIANEERLLEVLRWHPHKNVLNVHGIVTDAYDGNVRLVLQYCRGGSLDKYLVELRNSGQVMIGVGYDNHTAPRSFELLLRYHDYND